jgi:hypothetical protein
MKRWFLLVAVFILLISACGQKDPVSKTTSEDISQASEIIGVWKLAHHPHYETA